MPGGPSVFLLSESRHHMSAAVKPLLCSRSTALYPLGPKPADDSVSSGCHPTKGLHFCLCMLHLAMKYGVLGAAAHL